MRSTYLPNFNMFCKWGLPKDHPILAVMGKTSLAAKWASYLWDNLYKKLLNLARENTNLNGRINQEHDLEALLEETLVGVVSIDVGMPSPATNASRRAFAWNWKPLLLEHNRLNLVICALGQLQCTWYGCIG